MAVDAMARALAAGKVPVSAYEMAVRAGYTGTEEQFAQDMGNSGTNAANAAASASAAAASAESVADSAAQIATNTNDISDLKESLNDLTEVIEPHLQETSGMLTEIGEDKNILEGTTFTPNKYINGSTGTATNTGSSYAITGFIGLVPGKTYYYNKMFWGYWAFYSSNSEDSYIDGSAYHGGGGESSGNFTVPDGAYYGRFTVKISNEQTAWINTINKEPTGKTYYRINGNYLPNSDIPINPCDYSGNEITIFNKILCIGDSLTAGVCNYRENGVPVTNVAFPNYAYPKQLSKMSGIECTNMGLAGDSTEQWYNDKASADLSGYDAAIIMLGVNDALKNNGWTTAEETALTNIIEKLQSENNGIKIYLATIMPSLFYIGAKYDSVNNGIRAFVENYNDENVILFDLSIYGHTGEEKAYNNGHLTAYGYLILAKDCIAFISNHIVTNKMLYRFVQFINTNHEP